MLSEKNAKYIKKLPLLKSICLIMMALCCVRLFVILYEAPRLSQKAYNLNQHIRKTSSLPVNTAVEKWLKEDLLKQEQLSIEIAQTAIRYDFRVSVIMMVFTGLYFFILYAIIKRFEIILVELEIRT